MKDATSSRTSVWPTRQRAKPHEETVAASTVQGHYADFAASRLSSCVSGRAECGAPLLCRFVSFQRRWSRPVFLSLCKLILSLCVPVCMCVCWCVGVCVCSFPSKIQLDINLTLSPLKLIVSFSILLSFFLSSSLKCRLLN